MLPGIQLEALAHGCAACSCSFQNRHRIRTVYNVHNITGFYSQVELGIIGSHVRNYWMHLDCTDPTLKDTKWHMHPDLQHCIQCGQQLAQHDMVSPVFQVTDAAAINPSDPTDKGIALAERVYFVHAACDNQRLNKKNTNILYTP